MMSCLILALFVSFSLQQSLPGPWLEVIQWVDRAGENCPNMNDTGVKDLKNQDTGFAYNTNNVTYKRAVFQAAADCVYLNGYGLNSFLTNIVPKTNYSIGISYNATTVTVNDYNSNGCTGPVANTMVRSLNTCLQDGIEAGITVSRWFQFTDQQPPGYTPIGEDGPTPTFTLSWYTAQPVGCSVLAVAELTYNNNQKCQQIHSGLYIKGYCASKSSFTGCISNSSDCSSCTSYGNIQTDQCVSDFTGYGNGGNQNLPSIVSDVYVRCSAYSTGVSFAAFLLVVLALLI